MPDHNTHSSGRRQFLKKGTVAVGLAGFAGCVGGGDGNGSDGGSGGNFPSQEITFIVPYSTGGGFDTYARGLAEYMPEHLPNSPNIVVQNVPGAGGRRGTTQISRAEPNGYTIGIFNIPGMVASQIIQDTAYDLSQISWVGRVARSIYLLAVPSNSNYNTVQDLQNADTISFAVTGPGSTSYLSAIIAANAMNIPAEFVTGHQGSQEAIAAALRGDVTAVQYPTSSPSVRSPVERGDMRAIVYYANESPPDWAPNAVSINEAGFPDLAGQVNLQRCIGGPSGIPQARLNTLRTAFQETVQSDGFQQWAEDQGRPLDYASGQETAQIISNAQQTFEEYRDLLNERLR